MVTKPAGAAVDGKVVQKVPVTRVRWKSSYRLVPSRYPPISIFERIADPADWEGLFEIESLTNPRLREAAGQISLVPVSRRVSGPGASIVMAPFTHASPARPTRFSSGTHGVYYAARRFQTALLEVAFHMGRFYRSTADLPHDETFRTYEGGVDGAMHDLRKGDWPQFLHPDPARYGAPQDLARQLREADSNGIVYPSVRHRGGECLAAFWPNVVSIPAQTKHVMLKWNGERISAWFDYSTEKWADLAAD